MNPSPGPWRWEDEYGDEGGNGQLLDAQSIPIVEHGSSYEDIKRDDREVIAAAPGMREMLLKLEFVENDEGLGMFCPECGGAQENDKDDQHADDCSLAALLEKVR